LAEADSAVSSSPPSVRKKHCGKKNKKEPVAQAAPAGDHTIVTASAQTTSIVYGFQNTAVQGMSEID